MAKYLSKNIVLWYTIDTMTKDYYDILGVNKNATKDELKKAFHKAAHKHHPDKNGGDDKQFKEINEAYQTLSDDSKRSAYDRFGSGYAHQGGGNPNTGGFDPSGFGFDFNGQGFDGADLGDIFSDFFGGGYSRGRHQAEQGRDMSTEITISFEESMFGVERDILITKTSTCNDCNGTRAKKGTSLKKCPDCNGQGQIRENRQTILGVIATNKICHHCSGTGQIPEEKCLTCKGNGVYKKQQSIKVSVPMGIESGQMIKLVGMGEAVAGGSTGDLYVRIFVLPHKIIKREANNLIYPITIKITEALLGGEQALNSFDGLITIKIPAGVSHGEILRIKEKGVPFSKTKRGDLLVPIKISIPQKLTKKERQLAEELRLEGI